MKLPKELYNGIIIWLELVFTSSMKALDLADLFYLRALNILIYYGANRMLKVIIKKEKLSFP
jgi:hypothetical protein